MVKQEYESLVKVLVDRIGGIDNIADVTHCVTRLRFQLKDESKADTEAVKAIDGVITVVMGNGQYQVVVGNIVEDVFDTLLHVFPLQRSGNGEQSNAKSGNIIMRGLNEMAGILNPIVTALAGAGMIKAMLVILTTTLGILDTSSSTYKILFAASNSVFYFLPLFLAISSAKAFHCNPFIALAIVGALMEPSFTGLMKANGDIVSFLGIPVVMMNYAGTLLPGMVAVIVYAKLERVLKRIVPKSVEIFALSFLALIIMVPLSVMVIGPTGVALANIVGDFVNYVSLHNGLLTGLVVGGCWTLLVMVGIHWGIVPIMLNNLSTLGYDFIRPMVAAATFASAGAAFGVFLRAKNKKNKAFAASVMVPALLGGITEPIVYGISLRYKKPLAAQVIGGALAGAFMGAMHTKAIVYVFPALTTLPAFVGETFVYYVGGISLSFAVTAAITYMLGITEEAEEHNVLEQEQMPATVLAAAAVGEVVPLHEVDDEVFASKAMGDGGAIVPVEGELFSPVNGKVTAVFPTGHAVGITTDSGLEILLHIGINTVELKGKGFKQLVTEGQKVHQGDKLVDFDLNYIKDAGYNPTIMELVTNMGKTMKLAVVNSGRITPQDELIKVE